MKKFNYGKVFLLGFGFFAISITWSVYNSFMPLLLGKFIESSTIIGFIMTIDNYLALFIQPMVGAYSDEVNTRYGKRMPFIMIGMPIATVFIFLIPQHFNLWTLITFLVLMNLSMSIFRSPVVALMPDITPKEKRSKANSIINLMGGIGSVIAFLVGGILWKYNNGYPFYLASGLMILSFIVLFNFVKEKRDVLYYEKSEKNVGFFEGLANGLKNPATRNLLLAICCWFIGFNGIETFFTRYGTKFIGATESASAISFAFISISFLIFAVPAGIIGTKLGKKKTIILGIIGIIAGFIVAAFLRDLWAIRAVFIVLGIFWAFININSYPFVAEMAPLGLIGTYTGLYYLFSSIANIISPPLLGGVIDIIGYKYMFLYGTLFFALALFFISRVKPMGKFDGSENNGVTEN